MMKRAFVAAAVMALWASGSLAQQADIVRPVKLQIIEPQMSVLEREFFGQIVARQTVDLAFQVGGQINRFPAVEGSRVAAGSLIARLDLEPFQLALDQAKVQHQQALRDLKRRKTVGTSTVAQASIDEAKTAAELAAIAIRNAEYSLKHATLVAPFDGLVATRNVANFTTVAPGAPVLRLHDMSEIRVEIDVPEILFRRAQEGGDVETFAVVPGDPTRYPLEVREFNAETSTVGQTYTLTLALKSPQHHRLLPGSSVTVIARQASGDTRIYVPPSAVVIDPDDSTHLMSFEPVGAEQGSVRKIAVQLETDEHGRLAVVSGIELGAEVVAAGATALTDGQRVRRFSGFGD